jgi:GNAT superfamily N-acetyltransferase
MPMGVRTATEADLGALTETMATAFLTDPVWGAHSFPDPGTRSHASRRFWEYYLRAAMRLAATFVTPGCEAAAVWVPPGEAELTADQEARFAALVAGLVGREQARVVLGAFDRLDEAHPHDEPHWYLSLLATHTGHRARGLGMGLLGACLETVDAAHLPAYLESTNPGNDARYRRLGFEPAGLVVLPGDVPVTTMWRPAR